MARLEWDLFRVTPLQFIDNYCTQGLIFSSDTISEQIPDSNEHIKVYKQPGRKTLFQIKATIKQLSDKLLEHIDLFNGFSPEQVAVSIVVAAREQQKIDDQNKDIFQSF